MRLGVMNDPRLNACDEARWAASNGFEFLDLTIEGPGAALEQIDGAELRTILQESGLDVVGHTAWYLPFASPIARVRQAAVESVAETFDLFAMLGAKWVNVHIAPGIHLFDSKDALRWNGESFAALAEQAVPYGLGIMIEHPPNPELKIADIRKILNADQRLGFHLDVGHANIGKNKLEGMLKAFASRMPHVHLSDNRGRSDDHMPPGAGRIEWPTAIRLIKQAGYDDTITLEVFTPDRDYVLLSAKKVREWWDTITLNNGG
jgi:sugar phosphate isomerase/epimerase